MKTKKILFYLLAGILAGCVPSLHPLYTEQDLIFAQQLLGIWQKPDSNENWRFEKDPAQDNKYYQATYTDDKGNDGTFVAALIKLNGTMFLDLFPKKPECDCRPLYPFHFYPVHNFVKIQQIQPTLKMMVIDPEKVKQMLAEDPNLIPHEVVDDRLVITASTAQLQRFVADYADYPQLFVQAWDLRPQENKQARKALSESDQQ